MLWKLTIFKPINGDPSYLAVSFKHQIILENKRFLNTYDNSYHYIHTGKCKSTGADGNELVHWGEVKMAEKVNKTYPCFNYHYLIIMYVFYLSCHLAQRTTDALQFMILSRNM